MKELVKIQTELKAPKNSYNAFGKYKYRSCEDILEGLKSHLKANDCFITLADEVTELCGVLMIKATATITNNKGDKVSVTAYAGVDPNKKGMDISQTFGSSSSYARKYALNGLFAIDDTKDADTQDNRSNATTKTNQAPAARKKTELKINSVPFNALYEKYRDAESNDKRNDAKEGIRNYYTNAEAVITEFDKKYQEYLKAKN